MVLHACKAILTQQLPAGESNLYVAISLVNQTISLQQVLHVCTAQLAALQAIDVHASKIQMCHVSVPYLHAVIGGGAGHAWAGDAGPESRAQQVQGPDA